VSSLIKIGIIGDYDSQRPAHKATNEALNHCADYLGINLEIQWLPTELLEGDVDASICRFHGLWCAPGSPYKSMKGALNAIRFARENNYPFIGTCGGFQHTVIEYAQNKLGIKDDENGFKIVGTDETGEARILELPQNRFFVATLFQPQLSSLPANPHKLILAYLTCAKEVVSKRHMVEEI